MRGARKSGRVRVAGWRGLAAAWWFPAVGGVAGGRLGRAARRKAGSILEFQSVQ